jgi:hypothetical protein
MENNRVYGDEDDWLLSSDGKRILAYTGQDNDIIIPNYIGDKHITMIAPNSTPDDMKSIFGDRTGDITSVKISDGIKKIGPTAFFECKNATNALIIPPSVDYIGAYAFYNCINMTGDLVIPDNVQYINPASFAGCFGITSLKLPDNLKSVGSYGFYGCKNITDLFCGDNLKVIGAYAFQKCSALAFIKWSSKLIYIGNYAFADCTSITNLTLPNTLNHIGNSAFKNCSALKKLTFGTGKLEIGAYAFENCSALTSVTLPNSITSIGRHAFSLRASGSTSFSSSISLNCTSKTSAAVKYAKMHNVPIYIGEYNKTYSNFGDLNGNGKTEKADAKAVLRIAASMDKAISGDKLFACDINCNGKIDTGDVSYILQNS